MVINYSESRNRTNLDLNLLIRPLKKKDLPALEWNGKYKHFRNVYAQAFESARRGLSVLWVAELCKSDIVGQVFIQLVCDRKELANGHTIAYLYSFRIKPEYQGQGIGSKMLETIENDLKRRDFSNVCLNVAKDNTRAQSLYFKHGYKTIAHEPGRWSYIDHEGRIRHMNEPSWRMIKKLQ